MFFFFKQKTAYEMRISDWSSDVCSSDLYNWRDEFLSSTFDSWRPNPVYVEAYGQFDLSIGYQVSENFSVQAEAINLTDETTRSHGRHDREVFYATQTGPRYMLGFRYKF